MKIKEMNDTFVKAYIHQFQPEANLEISSSTRSIQINNILSPDVSNVTTKSIPIRTGVTKGSAMNRSLLV